VAWNAVAAPTATLYWPLASVVTEVAPILTVAPVIGLSSGAEWTDPENVTTGAVAARLVALPARSGSATMQRHSAALTVHAVRDRPKAATAPLVKVLM